MFLDKCAISHKACPIPLAIAFLKIFYQLTWIGWTFKTVGQSVLFYAVLYLAFSAMLRLSAIAVQTPCTWLFVITVFVTNHAVHSAWSKHIFINIFAWHFHNLCPFANPSFHLLSFIIPKIRERGNSTFSGLISYLLDIRHRRSKKCRLGIVHRWTSPLKTE